jgi:hypothetical protein
MEVFMKMPSLFITLFAAAAFVQAADTTPSVNPMDPASMLKMLPIPGVQPVK